MSKSEDDMRERRWHESSNETGFDGAAKKGAGNLNRGVQEGLQGKRS